MTATSSPRSEAVPSLEMLSITPLAEAVLVPAHLGPASVMADFVLSVSSYHLLRPGVLAAVGLAASAIWKARAARSASLYSAALVHVKRLENDTSPDPSIGARAFMFAKRAQRSTFVLLLTWAAALGLGVVLVGLLRSLVLVGFAMFISRATNDYAMRQGRASKARHLDSSDAVLLREAAIDYWYSVPVLVNAVMMKHKWTHRANAIERGQIITGLIYAIGLALFFWWRDTTPSGWLYVAFVLAAVALLAIIPARTINAIPGNTLPRHPGPGAASLLSFHVFHSLWLDGAWTWVTAACVIRELDWSAILLIPFTTPISRFVLSNATLLACKAALAAGFRIALFRRFDDQGADLLRGYVMPVIGSFGTLVTIGDTALTYALEGVNSDSAEVLSNVRHALDQSDDWKARVTFEVWRSDFVIFYWHALPTPFMEWEYEEAMRACPADRLLVLVPEALAAPICEWLSQHKHGSATPRLGILPSDRASVPAFLRTLLRESLLGAQPVPRDVSSLRRLLGQEFSPVPKSAV